MLQPEVISLFKSLLSEHYSKSEDYVPAAVEKREFGFGDFEKKIAFRHVAFKNGGELKRYLIDNSPPFVSCSSAEYQRPDGRPMEAKGWLGSELIFDLDATDLHLKCQEQHGRSWVCQNCLDSVKEETVRLVEDFLIADFGFLEKDIRINFSGNRGYHVHLTDSDAFTLDSKARRQISEYITGTGLEAQKFFEIRTVKKTLFGPQPDSNGWGGKFAKGMITALNSERELVELGIDVKTAKQLVDKKEEVKLGISLGVWDKVKIPKKAEFWTGVVRRMAIQQSDSIDRNVTNDTGHLLRLPNTIHGDTGLSGRSLGGVKQLQSFDPMKDAVVLRGRPLKVHVEKAPQFSIGGETFGPFEDKGVELPLPAALYLLLKKSARL